MKNKNSKTDFSLKKMKSKKIRLYVNKELEHKLLQFCGASRFIYNHYLSMRIRYYKMFGKTLSAFTYHKYLTKMRSTSKYKWLVNIDLCSLRKATFDCEKAFDNFFKNPRYFKFPKYKTKKKTKLSFSTREDRLTISKDFIKCTKLGKIFYKSKQLSNSLMKKKLYNARISYDNKYWYLSFSYEDENQISAKPYSDPIGIDLGVKTLAVLSNGKEYKNIAKSKKIKNLDVKIKKQCKSLSRKKYKSSNYFKSKKKLQLLYRRRTNIIDNHIKHMIKDIVYLNPSSVVIEDLDITSMLKNKHTNKVVLDCNFFKIRELLTQKCKNTNIKLVIANKWFPSSQICSNCGERQKLTLQQRVYDCASCGFSIDRDLNAAINLKNLAK